MVHEKTNEFQSLTFIWFIMTSKFVILHFNGIHNAMREGPSDKDLVTVHRRRNQRPTSILRGGGVAKSTYTHARTCTCMYTHVLNIHTPMYACKHSLCKH